MTEREMLEMAARAAGIVVVRSRLQDPMHQDMLVKNSVRNPHQRTGPYDPLTDDGDAFRLQVALHFTVRCYMGTTCVQSTVPGGPSVYIVETNHADPLAATRLAIVKAAASIGEKMRDEAMGEEL